MRDDVRHHHDYRNAGGYQNREAGDWRDDDDHGAWTRRQGASGGLREDRAFSSGRSRMARAGIRGTPDYDERRYARASSEYDGGFRYGDADSRYSSGDTDRRVPREETSRLIGSDKVEGTHVFDRRGERIGTIENFMVTKRSGRVEYAVMSFGGFMGMGDRHYPVRWDDLEYDERLDGYVVDLDRADLDRWRRDH